MVIVIGGISTSFGQSLKAEHIFPINVGHSYIGFQVKYMGYAKVRGRFAKFNGIVIYNEKDITSTSVSLVIHTESIDTDLDFRDNDLKSENWLEVEKYPEIRFISNKVRESKTGIDVYGSLTIKDVTKEVIVEMDKGSGVLGDSRGDSQVIFTGSILIDRTDYHVQGERWSKIREGIASVDSKVEIELSILGKRMNERNFRNWVRNPESPQGKIYALINEEGLDKGITEFKAMKNNNEELNANAMIIVGLMLMKENKVDDAIKVLTENVNAFPEDSNAHDTLAEAYLQKGDYKNATKYYQKSEELDPGNISAREILKHL